MTVSSVKGFSLNRLIWVAAAASIYSSQALAITQDPLPQVYTMSPTGVNLQTGRYAPTYTDLVIGPLKLVRGGPQTSFGNVGIKHNLGGAVTIGYPGKAGQPLLSAYVDGKTIKWAQASDGSWMPWNQEALNTGLTSTSGRWRLVGRDGAIYQFMPHAAYNTDTQVLDYVEYSDGHRLTYSYNSTGLLRVVSSNRGYALVLDYASFNGSVSPCLVNLSSPDAPGSCTTENGHSSAAVVAACGYNTTVTIIDENTTCANATLRVSYSYTARATDYGTAFDMTSVTDLRGGVTSLQYNTDGMNTCVTFVNSQTCQITNYFGDQPGDSYPHTKRTQVRKQVMASGAVWLLDYQSDYDPDNPPLPGEIRYSYSWLTDPLGNVTWAEYANGQIDQLNESGRTTLYTLNGSDLTKVVYPEGNYVQLQRDGDRIYSITKKAKPNSGLADIVINQNYPSISGWTSTCQYTTPKVCDKPIARIDANGKQTDYTYDNAHGMVLTETAPAVPHSLDPSYTVRPQTRYTYAQRYAWLSSGSGYVRAATPVWVLTQKSICKTGNYSASGCQSPVTGAVDPSDEVITTYDYGPDSGPNNLLLRGVVEDAGAGRLNLQTCYAYDPLGNKISETKPLGTGGACP